MNNNNDFILEMEDIEKSFPPVSALKNVTFRVRRGTVHALCGENGAGKSTLMKILSGIHQPDNGRILLNHHPVSFRTPAESIQAGISMLYQELELAGDMTVYENIFLGREILANRFLHITDRAAEIRITNDLITKYGFHLDPLAEIRTLSTGECQIVELLKALLRKAEIIVMDEPTSSLSEAESEILFKIIRELKKEGITIIYISHRMEEVKTLADEISVLRDGVIVGTKPADQIEINEIIKLMVGRELSNFYPPRTAKIGPVVFRTESLSAENGIRDVSFEVRSGEIAGFAGLIGAGRSETARAIFGIDRKTDGKCFLDNKELLIQTPADAIRSGIAFLTEDRKRTGLCTGLPCSWNITLPNYETIGMRTFLNLAKEYDLSLNFGKKVQIKWSTPDAPADSLSGGNQQKLLLARWLMANSRFMIFDEPTRGIDVGAKAEIYSLLNELAATGKAIMVISSDMQEIFGICDKIYVMRDGKITGCRQRSETSQEEILRLAAVGL